MDSILFGKNDSFAVNEYCFLSQLVGIPITSAGIEVNCILNEYILRNLWFSLCIHSDLEAESLVGSNLSIVVLNLIVDERTDSLEDPAWNRMSNREVSRNFDFTLGQDAVFATYGSTHRDSSSLVAFVGEAEGWSLVVDSLEWSICKLVPASTWLDSIFLVRENLSSVEAILSWSDDSAFSYSSELDIRISI